MRKILFLLVITGFVVITAMSIKAQSPPEGLPDYGHYASYACKGGCNWARCESGQGDCGFADQHECCRY